MIGIILFAPSRSSAIYRVPAAGGQSTSVTQLEAQQAGHRFPQFLPDGRHFLYYAAGTPENRGVYVGQLDGPKTQRLLDADSAAVYVSSGHLLFVRGATLFAQDFDPARLVLRGNPFPVSEEVAVDTYGAAVSGIVAGPNVFRSWFGRQAHTSVRLVRSVW